MALRLWVWPRDEKPLRATRLGVTVSRQDGSAVERNLFKRRLRESFRLTKSLLPRGWDLVAGPARRKKTPFPPPFDLVRRDLEQASRQLKTTITAVPRAP